MGVMNRAYQRGLTLTGLIFGGMVLVLVLILGMKVVPDVIEYFKIVSDVKAVAQSPSSREASPSELRKAYGLRAYIDEISSIKPEDIEVDRSTGRLILSFSYRKETRLIGPVSLVIDFEGSSDQ